MQLSKLRLCHTGRAGFTILELMIATMVFSVVMLVVAVGVIRTSDAYYKGVTSSKTQAAARAIMAEISQALEFSKSYSPPTSSAGVTLFCIDGNRYYYVLGQEVVDASPNAALHQGYHGFISDTSPCTAPAWPPGSALATPNARELLGRNMRIAALDITLSGNLYTVHLKLIYGDDDLLSLPVTAANLPNELCKGVSGSEFCAVSDLTTSVERRLL